MSGQKSNPWADFAIGASSSFVSNLINVPFQEHARGQNFYYGEKAADNADARWRKQYQDFFSPAAMLKQYREAGLSPSLLYGAPQGSGGATAPQGGGAGGLQSGFAPLDPTQLAMIDNIKADTQLKKSQAGETTANTANIVQDTANKLAENGLIVAKKNFVQSQTEYQNLVNEYTSSANPMELEKLANEVRYSAWLAEKGYFEVVNSAYDAQFNQETFKSRVDAERGKMLNYFKDLVVKNSQIQLNQQQIQKLQADIEFIYDTAARGWLDLEIKGANQKAQEEFWQKTIENAKSQLNIEQYNAKTERTDVIWSNIIDSLKVLLYGTSVISNMGGSSSYGTTSGVNWATTM